MRRGVHEHLEFGTGEIDFPPVLRALDEVGYRGLVAVELPRHSHAAPDVAAAVAGVPARRVPRATSQRGGRWTLPGGAVMSLPAALVVGNTWLDTAIATVRDDPGAIAALFPAVGRHCGRAPIDAVDGWRTDDAARCQMLLALPPPRDRLADEVSALYRFGDADEKRAVLRGLAFLDSATPGWHLTRDALRSNDTRLVAAAMGPYARHLDDDGLATRRAQVRLHGDRPVRCGRPGRSGGRRAGRACWTRWPGSGPPPAGSMPADALALLDRLTGGEPSRAHL